MRAWTCHKHVQSLPSIPSGGHRMGGNVTISPPQTRAVNIFIANAGRFCNRNSRQSKHKLSHHTDLINRTCWVQVYNCSGPVQCLMGIQNRRNLPSRVHLHSVLNLTLPSRTLAQWLAHYASGPVTEAIVGLNPTWDRLKDHFLSCSESTLAQSSGVTKYAGKNTPKKLTQFRKPHAFTQKSPDLHDSQLSEQINFDSYQAGLGDIEHGQ